MEGKGAKRTQKQTQLGHILVSGRIELVNQDKNYGPDSHLVRKRSHEHTSLVVRPGCENHWWPVEAWRKSAFATGVMLLVSMHLQTV